VFVGQHQLGAIMYRPEYCNALLVARFLDLFARLHYTANIDHIGARLYFRMSAEQWFMTIMTTLSLRGDWCALAATCRPALLGGRDGIAHSSKTESMGVRAPAGDAVRAAYLDNKRVC